ncbi:MAG: YggT family protein [bacterium]|nr:YggT family protein [bacterium]
MFLARFVQNVFQVWQLALFIWVILSWIPSVPRHHPAVQLLDRLLEPTLRPFRGLVPLGGIDISPLIAVFVYQLVVQVLVRVLATAAF